jgi:serine/threonine protein kinase
MTGPVGTSDASPVEHEGDPAFVQRYIHRDLRPRNVFLIKRRGRADFVKLLDFGLAKLILPDVEAKQTAMGMTFGDPRYMSPEQARGDTMDRRADNAVAAANRTSSENTSVQVCPPAPPTPPRSWH